MRGGTRFAISTFASLAIAVALTGCAGSSWQFWKTASTETPKEPVVQPAPAEPTGMTATPAPQPPPAQPMTADTATAVPAPTSNRFSEVAELSDVRFRPGQVTVGKADQQTLDGVVRWLKSHPYAVVMIEGHTDDQGTREGNLAAGEQRAASIKGYLVGHGVEASRVSISSAGAERPICMEKTDTCRAKNRRARFLVRQ